ncbi:MAG TPA: AraC family transcriptional regulator [Polyangiaceae bacterium]|nr:AraC family transcriptional regulator [Polyangiaceae bacterium]
MDVLTDVLQTVRVQGACYGRVQAGAPWAVSVNRAEDAKFHVVLSGACSLVVEGEAEPRHLAAGDIVALPHGDAHSLHDDPMTPARPLDQLCRPEKRGLALEVGGAGPRTELVSGRIRFESRAHNPLLSALPSVMVLPGQEGRAVQWLEPTLQFIAWEVAAGKPGAHTVVSRLADILFIQIVRGYLASLPDDATGWLGALKDQQIGAALTLIHQNPERDWTVLALAEQVAMSRSAFAARFNRIVGEPPLHYLTRWRMQKAAGLLREGQGSLAEIAEQVGYDSEAAFSKAFKRAIGSAPGAYRRAARDGASVAA